MKKILLTIVCVIGLLENNSYARIGETLAQCEVRYGSRITDKDKIRAYFEVMVSSMAEVVPKNGEVYIYGEIYYFFKTGDYVVCCKFYNDKVEAIYFMKNEFSMSPPTKLDDKEIYTFLRANKCEDGWIDRNGDRWTSPKSKQIAFIDTNVLKIFTGKCIDRNNKLRDLNEKKKADKDKSALDKF